MPRFLVYETAIHWIDTFRFLMGEVERGHRAPAPHQPRDRRRGCGLPRLRVRRRRDRPVRRQPRQRPRREQSAPHDGRDVARRLRGRAAARRRRAPVVEAASRRRARARLRRAATMRSSAAAAWRRCSATSSPISRTARRSRTAAASTSSTCACRRRRTGPHETGRRIAASPKKRCRSGAGTDAEPAATGRARPEGGEPCIDVTLLHPRPRRWRAALAFALVAPAAAQTVLKFSHTDQPGGLRQKAAELFGQKVEQYTQRPLQGAGLSGRPARQRSQGRGAAAARRHRLHGHRHRDVRDAHPDAEPDADALSRRDVRPGLEALRRLEVAEGAVRQGTGEGLPLPVVVRGGIPLDDDQGSAQLARRREGQEAAHVSQRDAALAARGDGLQHPDHAAARGVPRDPAGHRVGPGEPDRYDSRQQVLRSRAVRDADQPRLQPDPADDLREDVAEAVAGGPRGRHAARRRKPPTGAGKRGARGGGSPAQGHGEQGREDRASRTSRRSASRCSRRTPRPRRSTARTWKRCSPRPTPCASRTPK